MTHEEEGSAMGSIFGVEQFPSFVDSVSSSITYSYSTRILEVRFARDEILEG